METAANALARTVHELERDYNECAKDLHATILEAEALRAQRDALRATLIDFVAMADSPQITITGNWDGSTEGQWRATIREARDAIAKSAP